MPLLDDLTGVASNQGARDAAPLPISSQHETAGGMTTQPVFNLYGQFVYFIDGREIVSPSTSDAHPSGDIVREPVGGVPSPPAADRQPYYEAGWWAA